MDRDECKLVVAFCSKNSVCKEAVSLEIEHANTWRKTKYPEDTSLQCNFKKFLLEGGEMGMGEALGTF